LNEVDVLIVGAGPVGLALALALHHYGVDALVIDAAAGPIDRAKAHGLWGRTVEVLDTIGAAEPMVAAAQFPAPGRANYLAGRMVHRSLHPNMRLHHEPFPYSLFMPQHDTEACLEAELERRGLVVRRGVRLVDLHQDDHAVTATVDRPDGQQATVRAGWLVGCDGAHSATRRLVGLEMEGETLPNDVWQTECRIDWTHPRDLQFSALSLTRLGSVLAVYTPFSDAWHVTFLGFGDVLGDEPSIEDLQEVFRSASGLADVVLREPRWINRLDSTSFRLPERFISGRVLLAGDAAHARSALGGTGMNGGVQDAINLGWKLALAVQGAAAPTLVGTYEEEMYAEAVRLQDEVRANLDARRSRPPTLGRASSAGKGVGRRARLEAFAVGLADALCGDAPELEHRDRADQAMMGVHVRASSLSRDDRPSAPEPAPPPPSWRRLLRARGADRWAVGREAALEWLAARHPAVDARLHPEPSDVRAGDFLPDAVCRVAGTGTHLRHLLRDRRATLLLAVGDEPFPVVVERLDAIAALGAPLERWLRVLHVFPSEGWAERSGHPHDDPDVLVDGLFEVRRALQLTGPEVLYVRPDGYVGLRTRSLDPTSVLAYLRGVYRPDLLPA
jgi:2-polyprenyl-6-methoxyphenol hydroxylase-like FAD-dependent oxidoreductase